MTADRRGGNHCRHECHRARGHAAAAAIAEAVADLNRRLVRADIDVYSLREVQTSLEDWFLSVTSRLGEAS
jgi:hypothetical protein